MSGCFFLKHGVYFVKYHVALNVSFYCREFINISNYISSRSPSTYFSL